MKKKPAKPLNVRDYTKNAARNFTFTRLIIYTAFSLLLTVLLLVTTIQSNYEGTALTFCMFAMIIITTYTIMNIIALVKKIKGDY